MPTKPSSSEVQQLRKEVRVWWKTATALSRAGFSGVGASVDRAIAAEKRLVDLGITPPRRPKYWAD